MSAAQPAQPVKHAASGTVVPMCCITILADMDGLSKLLPKMIKVECAMTLQDMVAQLVDTEGQADSTEAYGFASASTPKKDYVQLAMEFSIGEVLSHDASIKRIQFLMHSSRVNAAAAGASSSPKVNPLAKMMSTAVKNSKPRFPDATKLVCTMNGAAPAAMYDRLVPVLRDKLQVTFATRDEDAGIRLIQDLHKLLWVMEKQATMRKLQNRACTVPAGLGSLQGAAIDNVGRTGGSKKAIVDVEEPITHARNQEWSNTLRGLETRPSATKSPLLRTELLMLANALDKYRQQQKKGYANKAEDVEFSKHSIEEDSCVRFIPAVLGGACAAQSKGFEWVVELLERSVEDGPVRITDLIHENCNVKSGYTMTRFFAEFAFRLPLYEFQFAAGGESIMQSTPRLTYVNRERERT